MSEISNYDLITVEELAATLEISRNSAYSLLKKGEIKSFKIGTHFYRLHKHLPEASLNHTGKMRHYPSTNSLIP